MPRRGGRRKKTRTHNLSEEGAEEGVSGPCSFIVKKGRVGKELTQLVTDMRELMLPNTFSKIKESKRNSADDYIQVAGGLGATHLLRVSCTEKEVGHLHVSRLPAGPSFDFRVDSFSLMSDLRKVLGSSAAVSREDGQFPPVAILNGFKNPTSEFTSLLAEALKGLVPPIEISKISLRTCRRVVLFEYNQETMTLSIRHFRVNVMKKSVAMLPDAESADSRTSCSVMLNSRRSSKIPNMGNLVSLSDLVTPTKAIVEADPSSDGVSSKSINNTIFLTEIGPRIDACLSRVLSGVEEGTVMFSQFQEVGTEIVRKRPKRKYGDDKPKRAARRARTDMAGEEFDDGEFSE